jgi:hypothetical protein
MFIKRRIKNSANRAAALAWLHKPMGDFETRVYERVLEVAAEEQSPVWDAIMMLGVEDVLVRAGLMKATKQSA